jgi:hypothetical protein
MKQLAFELDYIAGLFNQHQLINGQYAGRITTIEVTDEMRDAVFGTVRKVISVLNKQEDKDAAFERALDGLQHMAKVVNEQTDAVAIVNTHSFRKAYYGY